MKKSVFIVSALESPSKGQAMVKGEHLQEGSCGNATWWQGTCEMSFEEQIQFQQTEILKKESYDI